MKKLLSLGLVAAMAVSAMPMAYATTDVSNGTEVEYLGSKTTIDGEGNEVYAEAYTVTVPAKMAPGGSAFVKAEGTWNSARKLVVTADENVVLENNINKNDKKTLAVTFNGIELAGDNNVAVANYGDGVEGEAIAVGNIENALFGTWSGVFEYQAEIVDNIPARTISFTIEDEYYNTMTGTYQAKEGMTWGEWLASEYNTFGASQLSDAWIGIEAKDEDGSYIGTGVIAGPSKSNYEVKKDDVIVENGDYWTYQPA